MGNIPSLTEQLYQEGLDEGILTAAASLLRIRFGDHDRIQALAERLARLGATECMARIEAASRLEELDVDAA